MLLNSVHVNKNSVKRRNYIGVWMRGLMFEEDSDGGRVCLSRGTRIGFVNGTLQPKGRVGAASIVTKNAPICPHSD
jgi:hypothetical protein